MLLITILDMCGERMIPNFIFGHKTFGYEMLIINKYVRGSLQNTIYLWFNSQNIQYGKCIIIYQFI